MASIFIVKNEGFIHDDKLLFDSPLRGLLSTTGSVKVRAFMRLLAFCESDLSFACKKVSNVHVGRGNLRFFSSSLLKPSPAARLLRLDLPVEEVGVVCAVEGTCFAAGGTSTFIVLATVRASAYVRPSSYPQCRVEWVLVLHISHTFPILGHLFHLPLVRFCV